MKMHDWIIVAAVLIEMTAAKSFIMGPASIYFNKIADCPGAQSLPVQMPISMHKLNRTVQALDANLSLPFDMDASVGLTVQTSKWGDGGWKHNAFAMNEKDMCRTMNFVVGELWYDIQRKGRIEPGVCPIKKGNYYLKDIVLDLRKMRVQSFFYGKFKTKVMYTHYGKPIMCKDFELELNEII